MKTTILNDINTPVMVEGYDFMLNEETRRRTEMDEYMSIIEKKIFKFKKTGSSGKLEIMNEILVAAESFIDYYTEE